MGRVRDGETTLVILMHSAQLEGYSGSEAKAHPFTGGMKPTTANPSTLVATTGVGCLQYIAK
jgi:hypothetical protein